MRHQKNAGLQFLREDEEVGVYVVERGQQIILSRSPLIVLQPEEPYFLHKAISLECKTQFFAISKAMACNILSI